MLRKSRMFVVVFFTISVVVFVIYHAVRITTNDRTIPVIEMDSDSIVVSVKGGDEAILEGVTATDGKDGDITENLFIESRTTFFEKGRFNVTIAVADRDNHVTKVTREVSYSDYKSPQFSLSGPLKFLTTRESQDDLNITKGLSAKDVVDGNISNRIKISSDYSIVGSIEGDYHMLFLVTNSMGDTARLPVTITIYSAPRESGLPQLILSKYLINIPVGKKVDLMSLVEQIDYRNLTYRRGEDGNYYSGEFDSEGEEVMFSADSVQIDSDVNWDLPGVYEAIFTFKDNNTEASNYARCFIVVY